MSKILFLLKKRNTYGSYGLINSCDFIVNSIRKHGFKAHLVQVIDANEIDREVTKYRPNFVVIEAIWVTPEKLKELARLHPHVKWLIRIHSHTPFLAIESIAFKWLGEYQKIKNVTVAANDARMANELRTALDWQIVLLPNVYSVNYEYSPRKSKDEFIDIGCFGALRPLKNHLQQAMAVLTFAQYRKRIIRFHINQPTVEAGYEAQAILKNLEAVFETREDCKLIKHTWRPHKDFIKLVRKMDVGMQVSFSETFNIVAADFVDNDIPIVGSPEIIWLADDFKANPNKVKDIFEKLTFALNSRCEQNKELLNLFNRNALAEWLTYFNCA